MPPLNRRDLIRAAAATAVLSALPGCDDDGSAAPPSGDGEAAFRHGVASGDPLADRVILWTRVTPAAGVDSLAVNYLVATDPDFGEVVAAGTVLAEAQRDFTVKVDAAGLAPDRRYYYAFEAAGQRSPLGRTRTLPAGSPERLRLAVVTCGDYSRGYFNAYARVAAREDLHAVVHLGDYIYENGNTDRVRPHEPPHAAVTLADYRTRYAQYREDEDLQALHAQHPMIWVWDDHELANNAWRDGADNHDPETDGPFELREAAALAAVDEWLPIRLPEPENPRRIYRDFAFGDLVDLVMLDTRRIGRDEPLAENTVVGDNLPAFTQTGGFDDPERQLLGAEQEAWLFARLAESRARWRLVGTQVMLAQLKVVGAPRAVGGGVYGNPDQWDGYQSARDRLFAAMQAAGVDNTVFLAGDFHVAFASEITPDPNNPAVYNPLTGAGSLAVEFVTPSVSSAGDPAPLTDPELLTDPGDLLEQLVVTNPEAFRVPNPHIKLADGRNGYTLLDVTADHLRAEFWFVPLVGERSDEETLGAAFTVPVGEARLIAE